MEVSGTVAQVGPGVSEWAVGQHVCALLAGGGYAEFVAVPAAQLLPIPDGVDLIDAAGLPEGDVHRLVQSGHDRRPDRR